MLFYMFLLEYMYENSLLRVKVLFDLLIMVLSTILDVLEFLLNLIPAMNWNRQIIGLCFVNQIVGINDLLPMKEKDALKLSHVALLVAAHINLTQKATKYFTLLHIQFGLSVVNPWIYFGDIEFFLLVFLHFLHINSDAPHNFNQISLYRLIEVSTS